MRTASARRLLALVAAVSFAGLGLTLTACNTVKGMGTDLQEASENTSEAIDNAVND